MLQRLEINNFAIIQSLSVEFGPGLSVITGETGAGKSILLEGLSLALGKRADLSVLKDSSQKAVIEALFYLPDMPFEAFFSQNDLDQEPELRLRRELTPSGKSRAFINDTPVTLEVLSALGGQLIDVHAQHQTLQLFDQKNQLSILDGIADVSGLLIEYQSNFQEYEALRKKLAELQKSKDEAIAQQDYLAFLAQELSGVDLREGIYEELVDQERELANATEIAAQLGQVDMLWHQEQLGVLEGLKQLKSIYAKLSSLGAFYADLAQRVDAGFIELNDIAQESQRKAEGVESDPSQLAWVQDQLAQLDRLMQKHQVVSVIDLANKRDQINQSLGLIEDQQHLSKELQMALEGVQDKLTSLSNQLTHARKKAIPVLESELITLLSPLGMPKARFNIVLREEKQFRPHGRDQIEFLFSANSGSPFGPLSKVASGGELSRIMLSVKSILVRYTPWPTIIFDEIDSGVSGEVSNKMGEIMAQMAQRLQVFSITHLPQVAARGAQHYKVYKQDDGVSAQTHMLLIDQEQRVLEIAEMLGGRPVTESAVAHAKQLLLR